MRDGFNPFRAYWWKHPNDMAASIAEAMQRLFPGEWTEAEIRAALDRKVAERKATA